MGGKKPRQSDLKRSVSTVYYALFHTLCRQCADCLIGTKGSDRSNPAWRQAYRAVAHGHAKGCCENQKIMKTFPKEIEDFGNAFVTAQIKRHSADYDPAYRVIRSEVIEDINVAEQVIKDFKKCPVKDRRAFSAWVTLTNRK